MPLLDMWQVILLLAFCQVSLQSVPHLRSEAALIGARRRLSQTRTVTIGYGSGYKYKAASSDAITQFNAAMAELKAAGGGTLDIGNGTFTLSKPFLVTVGKLTIRGKGMGKTIIKLKDNAAAFPSAGFLRARGINDVFVRDLTFDGNKAKQSNTETGSKNRYCIFMSDYKNWRFERVRCIRWQRYAFDPHGIKVDDASSSANKWGYNLTIIDCEAIDNNWDGFTIDQTIGAYLKGNKAINNGRYGYNVVTASRNVLLENNIAINNGYGARTPEWLYDGGNGCGFYADTNRPGFDTYNVTFRFNTAEKSFRAGFCVKDSGRIYILNNVIKDAGACANWKRLKAQVEYKNNRCSKAPKQFSIESAQGTAPVLNNNTWSAA